MKFNNQTNFYQGKVRDVYTISNSFLVMVASDRISAFDVILPKNIPYKGQVLNQTAEYFLDSTKDIVKNWLIATPFPNTSIGYNCKPYPVEIVVRGYLSGHAWRLYQSGIRKICGVSLPDNLSENDKLPTPIITPTTKAHQGHDEDISKDEILSKGLISVIEYEIIEDIALKLFERGTQMAKERNLILVDTKYEFGQINDEIILIDEIHTPDSSRYFYLDSYQENQDKKLPQKQLSKEFVRKWLIDNNFQGKENQTIPDMPDSLITEISERYIQLYETITGLKFQKSNNEINVEKINKLIESYL